MTGLNRMAMLLTVLAVSACGVDNNNQSSSASSTSSTSSSSSIGSSSSSGGIGGPGEDLGGVDTFTDLPEEYRISDDGEKLEMGGFYIDDLFNPANLEVVEINFSQQNYLALLEQNYSSKTDLEATITFRGETYDQVGVRYRGLTSYRMAGDKKSFAVDLDYMIEGQDIEGYDSFKLNNAAEDASNIREVLYCNLANENIPACKAGFAHVFVNGVDQGVYALVQELDKDHAKQWFFDNDATRWRAEAPGGGSFGGGGFGGGGFGGGGFGGGVFGAGTSSLNDLGEFGTSYEEAYTLKFSERDDPWQDLANAAHTMGTVPTDQLIERLSPYMDIDAALWMIATENIFVDDDSYINKGGMDYYVYFDVATERLLPIEYDGNSTMGRGFGGEEHATLWTPFYNEDNPDFPLMNVLLKVPELRQRYLAHYRTLIEEVLDPSKAASIIDDYVSTIQDAASGAEIKPVTDQEFQSGIEEVRNYFTVRRDFVLGNPEVNATGLTIDDVVDSVDGQASVRPTSEQSVDVSARISGGSPRHVNLYFGTGLAGSFSKSSMTDNNSDGLFEGTIPAFDKGTYVRYYVEAIADDSAGTATYEPAGAEHDVYIYQVQAAEFADSSVVINELMAKNETTVTNEQGDYSDWLELYNNSDSQVDLSGYFLTDEDIRLDRWAFPQGTTIGPRQTLIVWLDDEEELGGMHANFKLSADGEWVYLVTPQMQFADAVRFEDAPEDQSYYRSPNGTGDLRWGTPSFDSNNP